MSAPFRTAAGGRVDRASKLNFTFDGDSYVGLRGDTLASALLSHGVHLVGRSFKYSPPAGFPVGRVRRAQCPGIGPA